MSQEEIVLVNKLGKPIGVAPKLESHHGNTPLHLGFSCYLFRQDGKFLLTQRALVKKVWPGVWTNSVCGHPASGESFEDAIRRRIRYELGIKKIDKLAVVLSDYRYITPAYNGIVENEVCPVYVAWVSMEPSLNPEEVEDYKWVDWTALPKLISGDPDSYSYWFKDQLTLLNSSALFNKLKG